MKKFKSALIIEANDETAKLQTILNAAETRIIRFYWMDNYFASFKTQKACDFWEDIFDTRSLNFKNALDFYYSGTDIHPYWYMKNWLDAIYNVATGKVLTTAVINKQYKSMRYTGKVTEAAFKKYVAYMETRQLNK